MRGHWGISAPTFPATVLLMLLCRQLWVTRDGNEKVSKRQQIVDRWYFIVGIACEMTFDNIIIDDRMGCKANRQFSFSHTAETIRALQYCCNYY